jgi:predicted ribosome quality control (RQC) complex YloA/Tae2 family protein
MANERLDALRADTARALEAQRKRLIRKRDAIRADLGRIAEANEAARIAALAVPTISTVRRGARTISVVDHATGEPVTHSLSIDPALAPRDALERLFQRSRRLRRGEPVAAGRLRDAEAAIATIDAALTVLPLAEDEDALNEARENARLPTAKHAERKPLQQRKPPFRTFRSLHGDVWVGRGAAKNEELTFRVAKPYHLWLHVRGTPGAHVVVPVARERAVTAELLVDAAHLAVHFSDARGERVVEVSYVQRKFVRKPKGAPPGTVTMEREKVLALRVEPSRIEHLLTLEIEHQNE